MQTYYDSQGDSRFASSAHAEYSVYAIFSNSSQLESAIEELTKEGFPGDRVSVFLSHQGNLLDDHRASALGEGLVFGTIFGALLAAILGWVFNVRLLSSDTSGSHWYIITNAVIGGMIGSAAGAIIGQMIPTYRVEKYQTHLKEGSLLVKIVPEGYEHSMLAKKILEKHGAHIIEPAEVTRLTKKAS